MLNCKAHQCQKVNLKNILNSKEQISTISWKKNTIKSMLTVILKRDKNLDPVIYCLCKYLPTISIVSQQSLVNSEDQLL